MDKLLDWLTNPTNGEFFSFLISALCAIVALIWDLVSVKIKNERIRRLVAILPEAMTEAEKTGGTGQEKLLFVINYVKKQIKGLTDDLITEFIERGVIISKNVNSNVQENKSSSSLITRR